MQQPTVDGQQPIIVNSKGELPPAAALLGEVVALAAWDCRRALKSAASGKPKEHELTEAASACRFFLSATGQSIIHAVGLGHEGVRAGESLARTTLNRLDIDTAEILDGPESIWAKVVTKSNLKHAPAVTAGMRSRMPPPFQLVPPPWRLTA